MKDPDVAIVSDMYPDDLSQRPPFMFLGSVGQPSTRRYGLAGPSAWGMRLARGRHPTPTAEMTIAMSKNPTRSSRSIKSSLRKLNLFKEIFL